MLFFLQVFSGPLKGKLRLKWYFVPFASQFIATRADALLQHGIRHCNYLYWLFSKRASVTTRVGCLGWVSLTFFFFPLNLQSSLLSRSGSWCKPSEESQRGPRQTVVILSWQCFRSCNIHPKCILRGKRLVEKSRVCRIFDWGWMPLRDYYGLPQKRSERLRCETQRIPS